MSFVHHFRICGKIPHPPSPPKKHRRQLEHFSRKCLEARAFGGKFAKRVFRWKWTFRRRGPIFQKFLEENFYFRESHGTPATKKLPWDLFGRPFKPFAPKNINFCCRRAECLTFPAFGAECHSHTGNVFFLFQFQNLLLAGEMLDMFNMLNFWGLTWARSE